MTIAVIFVNFHLSDRQIGLSKSDSENYERLLVTRQDNDKKSLDVTPNPGVGMIPVKKMKNVFLQTR